MKKSTLVVCFTFSVDDKHYAHVKRWGPLIVRLYNTESQVTGNLHCFRRCNYLYPENTHIYRVHPNRKRKYILIIWNTHSLASIYNSCECAMWFVLELKVFSKLINLIKLSQMNYLVLNSFLTYTMYIINIFIFQSITNIRD